MEKYGQQLLMRANQRKSDFMNIYYIYPIHWLSSFMQELINPMDLLAAAPGDHFSPLPSPSLRCGNGAGVGAEGQTGVLWEQECPAGQQD